jgi:type I restriction enzyme S subunit
MTEWKEVNIGSLGEVITGNTPPTADREYYGGHYPFIKPTDMDLDRRRVTQWEESLTEKAFKKFKNSYIPVGATGVVTIGTVGEKIFQADRNCFTNQSVNVVIPNFEYDPDFVYYLLKFNLPKVSAANPGTASGRHHVSKSNFCAINVAVPKDKLVQAKIGKILSAYDDLIENNLKRIKLLEELAQRTYEEWFVKFRVNGEALEIDEVTGLPIGWEEKEFKFFGEVVTGKTPSTLNREYFNGRIPFVKTPDMADYPYVVRTTQKLSELGANTQKKKFIPRNSLMVSCIGSAGVYALASENCQTNQQINSIAFFEEYYFSYFYCLAKKLKPVLEALGSNGATMTNVNKGKFEKMKTIYPGSQILSTFHKLHCDNFKLILNIQHQNENLKEARDMLLPRLMNGSISIAAETISAAKIIQLEAPVLKPAPSQFKEAILISMLADRFGSKRYPLGRMRYTKLSYLFHRHADNQIKDYLRKAAGPYNPKTKYGGAEKIAHDNCYVIDHKNGPLSGFVAGPNIEDARPYFEKYWKIEYLTWLEEQFKYKSNDELELFATVDNSLIELNEKDEPFTAEAVKNILKKEPEWTAKLEREIFNDANIQRAITYLPTIFQY